MKGLLKYITVAVKGACMGAADVIPGVSGGTIAFIMGIYDEFVGSLASINAEAVKLLFSGKFKAFWKHINGNFLLSLIIKQDLTVALYQVLGGSLILAAFFMITDYSTTPLNPLGKMVFAFGCGVITVLIRFWGSYPEGVSFAILLMNILSPYIEKLCTKKPFGKVGK